MKIKAIILILPFLTSQVHAYPDIVQIKDNQDYLLIQSDFLPIIDLKLSFSHGSINDGPDKGITSFSLNLLHQQLINDKKAISLFEQIGAEYNSNVGKESSEITLRFISSQKNLEFVANKLNLLLRGSAVTEEIISDNKEKVINIIKRRNIDPGRLIQNTGNEIYFKDTPYSHPTIGYIDNVLKYDIEKITKTLEKIRNSKKSFSLVGDINENSSAYLISKILNGINLNQETKHAFIFEQNSRSKKKSVVFDSSQTHINYYIPAVTRTDEDYYNLLVVNHIFGGGGFGSRLMTEIREKRGLAYSVYSYLLPYEKFGLMKIGLQTDNKNVLNALKVINNELEKIKNLNISNEEISSSKKSLIKSVSSRIDTNKNMLDTLAAINSYDLQDDYFRNYIRGIQSVTKKSIDKTISKKLAIDQHFIITLGGK
tara:strand:+ start:79 stop:1359 length:1281 start_codon:yes stop_codon:yes gene_type:complete